MCADSRAESTSSYVEKLTQDWKDNKLKGIKKRKAESYLPASKLAIRTAVEPCIASLEEWKHTTSTGTPTRFSKILPYLKQVDSDVAIFVALVTLFNGISEPAPLLNLALTIGNNIQTEVSWDVYANDPNVCRFFHWVKNHKFKNTNSVKYQKTSMSILMKRQGCEGVSWSKETKVLIGCVLLDIIIINTGFIFEYTKAERKKQRKYIAATPEFLEWLELIQSELTAFQVIWTPSKELPREWVNVWQVPYQGSTNLPKIPLLNHRDKQWLKNTLIPRHLKEAINHLQRTPWVINEDVLEVLEVLKTKGREVGKLVSFQPVEKPPKPDGEWESEEVLAWRKIAMVINERNAKNVCKRVKQEAALNVIKTFCGEKLWFPYNGDFRGRIYAVPRQLSPQGDDTQKGLLKFADPKPLKDDRGVHWFEVLGSNLYGNDKVSFNDRQQWTREFEQQIVSSAESPFDYRWWEEADEPFQFLGWCFEYKEWLNSDPYSFESYLPCHVDGSCSGLQHYSALLRDEVGGKSVNLTSGEKPADIYTDVLKEVLYQLEQQPENEMALNWLSLNLDRKLTKSPTMTFVYGSTLQGWRDGLDEWLEDREAPWDVHDYKVHSEHTIFLAKQIQLAINKVVVKATEAMDWLSEVSRIVGRKAGDNIEWTTPLGLPVKQFYPKTESKRIRTSLFGQLRLTYEIVGTVDIRKSASSFPPNFIHSMDACHLQMSILKAKQEKLNYITTIHDSFGVHCCDVDNLQRILRESFVELYTDFSLDTVKTELEHKYQIELPPPPAQGFLDLNEVLVSPYLFG